MLLGGGASLDEVELLFLREGREDGDQCDSRDADGDGQPAMVVGGGAVEDHLEPFFHAMHGGHSASSGRYASVVSERERLDEGAGVG